MKPAPASAPPCALAYHGALESLTPLQRTMLQERSAGANDTTSDDVRRRVHDIVADVRLRRDEALFELAQRFDGATLQQLEVPAVDLKKAFDALDNERRVALEHAARNIRRVHEAMCPTSVEVTPEPGVVVERRPEALSRVGVYAPGGRAAYPSSLLMGAIPARVAGVREVIVCTPPDARGQPSLLVLAAAHLAKVDRVFAVGGAGAIAAMAFGTATIPRVDRIVGPGNAYVAEAKLQLVNQVAIDSPAGPSELLVLAAGSSSATRIAQEMLAQAEHDPEAAVVALLWGNDAESLGGEVHEQLARLLVQTPRADIAQAALAGRGALLTCASLEAAVAFANDWAAEHLLLLGAEDAVQFVREQLRRTGTVFTGDGASVAFGDYLTGANHVLPTNGLARAYSGLSTLDFVRWTTWQTVTASGAARLSADTVQLARAEGLDAHAKAAELAALGAP